MAVQALQRTDEGQQLALLDGVRADLQVRPDGRTLCQGTLRAPATGGTRLCAACREREARYGFREDAADPLSGRPHTLCFDCFRREIGRRQAVAAQLARGWNGTQAGLPLAGTLEKLDRRRRRAQIAARHALDLR